ncbi:MAG: hypothetical protein ABIF77_06055, partial [bacterium]
MYRMNRHCRILVPLSVAVVLIVGGAGAKAEENKERPVAWEDLPTAVQETIQKEADGKTSTELEEITSTEGIFYEAEWLEGEMEVEILVASDGKLLDREVEKADAGVEDDDDDDD